MTAPGILRLRKWLGLKFDAAHYSAARLQRVFDASRLIVQIYYLASFLLVAQLLRRTSGLTRSVDSWDFLWPLWWVGDSDVTMKLKAVAAVTFLVSLAAIGFHRIRAVRVLFSLCFLMTSTIVNSHAGINHPFHAWFWVSFILIFLPDAPRGATSSARRQYRLNFAVVLFAVQVAILFMYSLSGFWKVQAAALAPLQGAEGGFAFRGLSANLANRVVQTDTEPLLADLAIRAYLASWLGYLMVMYFQLVAVLAAFRRSLHLVWGLALSLFHFGTWLLMDIIFVEHELLLILLLAMSPFHPDRLDLRRILRDLPLFGGAIHWLLARSLYRWLDRGRGRPEAAE